MPYTNITEIILYMKVIMIYKQVIQIFIEIEENGSHEENVSLCTEMCIHSDSKRKT